MEQTTETEQQALKILAEMVQKFALLYILNISESDRENLRSVRRNLEKIIEQNGYRVNYDRNIKTPILKI